MTLRRGLLATTLLPLLAAAPAMATETVPVLSCQAETPVLHLAKRADGMPVLHVECTRPGEHPEDHYAHFKQSSRADSGVTIKRTTP